MRARRNWRLRRARSPADGRGGGRGLRAGGAADAGDDGDVLRPQIELGEGLGERGQHRIVAATGAPDRLVIGLECLRRERRGNGGRVHERLHSVICWWISPGRIGNGPGWRKLFTLPGRSYSARKYRYSCPV